MMQYLTKALLAACWFMLLTFPVMGIKLNSVDQTVEWQFDRVILLGVAIFFLSMLWNWCFSRKARGIPLIRLPEGLGKGLHSLVTLPNRNTTTRLTSLGLLLAAGGFGLLLAFRRRRWDFLWFGLGGTFGLLLAYGPFCLDRAAFDGLCAAQRYHAARGGFSPTLVVGSLSRLVRWYLPAFVLLGLAVRPFAASVADGERPGADAKLVTWLLGAGFLAVFLLQLMAPCPYDDYQVPVMGLLAVVAVSQAVVRIETDRLPRLVLLATGLAFATAFGSPLLERWTTNGQARFWTLRKERSELAQLREAAAAVERLDPGGKTLLTQDLYLAVESGRSVPEGLEMGPFSQLTDGEWRTLLSEAECPVAALSGYAFAIEPPACAERPKELQEEFRRIVRGRYRTVETVPAFGQNATTLEIMKRKVGL